MMTTDAKIVEINTRRQRAYYLLLGHKYSDSLREFLEVFDGKEVYISNCIAYIYSRKDFSGYDPEKAISYFTIGSELGDNFATNAIGDVYASMGQNANAMNYYSKAAEAGNAESFYSLYQIYMRRNELKSAFSNLERSAALGHPPAITTLAILSIEGRFGPSKILSGIISYFRNIPNLIRYSKKVI